jgi:hypothetical protein
MTSRLHFELFMRDLRVRAAAAEPKQRLLFGLHPEGVGDVGNVRLSQIEAALRDARADTPEK